MTVSVVPLNANAVATVHVEAKANPKKARILKLKTLWMQGAALLYGLERQLIPFASQWMHLKGSLSKDRIAVMTSQFSS